MNQNGFLKPKIKTGFDLIRSVSVQLNVMNTALVLVEGGVVMVMLMTCFHCT